jgi:hypothetical protein
MGTPTLTLAGAYEVCLSDREGPVGRNGFDMRRLAPVVAVRFEDQFDARLVADDTVGAQADGLLLQRLIPDFLDIALGHYSACP